MRPEWSRAEWSRIGQGVIKACWSAAAEETGRRRLLCEAPLWLATHNNGTRIFGKSAVNSLSSRPRTNATLINLIFNSTSCAGAASTMLLDIAATVGGNHDAIAYSSFAQRGPHFSLYDAQRRSRETARNPEAEAQVRPIIHGWKVSCRPSFRRDVFSFTCINHRIGRHARNVWETRVILFDAHLSFPVKVIDDAERCVPSI